MNDNQQIVINNAQKGLDILKKMVIGIVISRDKMSLIINYSKQDNSIIYLDITPWGAIQTTHKTVENEEIHLIPNGQSLYQLIQKPVEFSEFYSKFAS